MVRDNHRIGTAIGGQHCILRMQDAFDDEFTRPHLSQLPQVVPAQRIGAQAGAAHRQAGDLALDRTWIIFITRHAGGHDVARQHAEHPARMFEHVPDIATCVLEGHGEAIAHVVFTITGGCTVDRYHQRFIAGVLRAFNQLVRKRTIRPHIELEPESRTGYGLGDFFH